MTWTLIRKELQQHGVALGFLAAGMLVGYVMIIVATLVRGQAGSAFDALRLFIIMMGLLSSLLVCHRLVVVEYQSRTQLFLEGLPVARWRMIAVKYGLGLLVMVLFVAFAFLIAWTLALRREILAPKLLAIVGARSFSVTWAVFNFCFLMGLTGRCRISLYLATFLGVALLAEETQLEISRFGPFALLDGRFSYEGETPPWDALKTTWLLATLFLLLIGVLSLMKEGSVAAILAERMSHRERVLIAAFLVGLVWAGTLLGEKTKKVPFDLNDAAVARKPGVMVKVAQGETDDERAAENLAKAVATELSSARDYLGLKALPTIFITRRRDLDVNRYERGELEKSEGVHVQANFEAKGWRLDDFQAWLLQEVLVVASDDRVSLESKRWVLDGFPLFWTSRQKADSLLAENKPLTLRALYGTERGFALADHDRWLTFRERVGKDIASGVAWSGLKTLSRHQGPDACQRFVRSVLGSKDPKDFRAGLRDRKDTTDRLLTKKAGVELKTFFAQWQTDLAGARTTLTNDLARLPRIRGAVDFIALSPDSRKVRYHIVIAPLPEPPARYSFDHRILSAFDEEVDPKSIQRDQNGYPQVLEAELPETVSRGARLYSTFSLEVPVLGCEVISGWQREEIR